MPFKHNDVSISLEAGEYAYNKTINKIAQDCGVYRDVLNTFDDWEDISTCILSSHIDWIRFYEFQSKYQPPDDISPVICVDPPFHCSVPPYFIEYDGIINYSNHRIYQDAKKWGIDRPNRQEYLIEFVDVFSVWYYQYKEDFMVNLDDERKRIYKNKYKLSSLDDILRGIKEAHDSNPYEGDGCSVVRYSKDKTVWRQEPLQRITDKSFLAND